MAGFGRLILSIDFNKLLCSRTNLLNFYQNVSRNTMNSIHETVIPPKPKKPPTAFILYVKHLRQKLINEAPNMKPSELIKKASLEWAELDPAQKEDFRREYNENYAVYVKELKEFEESLTDEHKQLLKEKDKAQKHNNKLIIDKRKKEAFGKPKRPLNAFLSYTMSKKHEKDPNLPYKRWLQLLSTNWKHMSDAEKKPYVTENIASMIQYRKDLSEWEKKMINLGHSDIVRTKSITKFKNIEEE